MSKLSKKKLETLLGSQKSTPLSAKEKAKMRMQLAGFIEEHPVQSSWTSIIAHRVFRLRPIFASLTVVVLFSSVSLASAQTALPGDTLYDLKLFVNEEVPMIFMDETEKQDFVVKQMDSRLKEAELLKEKGELTFEQQAVLQSKFDDYFDKIAEHEHPIKIRKDLSVVLEQHQDVLPQFTVVTEFVETTDVEETDQKPDWGYFKPRNSMTLKEFFEATHKTMEELEIEEIEDENAETAEGDEVEAEDLVEQESIDETDEVETGDGEESEDGDEAEAGDESETGDESDEDEEQSYLIPIKPIKVPLDEASEVEL